MPAPRLVTAPPKYKKGDVLVALTESQVDALYQASKRALLKSSLGRARRRLADTGYWSRG